LAVIISAKVADHIRTKHDVSESEARQCFENRTGGLLIDTREDHKSDPPTMWFIAPTNKVRLLKVCFVQRDGDSYLRTAYEPNADELRIYRAHGKPSDF